MRLEREPEALEALRRAAQLEPRNPEVLLALGAAAARSAGMDQAILSWQRYLVEAGDRPSVTRVREMLDCVVRLRALLKGVEDGDLPKGLPIADIAGFYTTFMQGLAVRARDGASRASMMAWVDGAMAAWPALTRKPKPRSKK